MSQTKKKKTLPAYWNHRIMVDEYNGEKYFGMHEVHYKKGKPSSYSTEAIKIVSETLSGIGWTINQMTKACDITEKPILWKGDRFPEVYIPEPVPMKPVKFKKKKL